SGTWESPPRRARRAEFGHISTHCPLPIVPLQRPSPSGGVPVALNGTGSRGGARDPHPALGPPLPGGEGRRDDRPPLPPGEGWGEGPARHPVRVLSASAPLQHSWDTTRTRGSSDSPSLHPRIRLT